MPMRLQDGCTAMDQAIEYGKGSVVELLAWARAPVFIYPRERVVQRLLPPDERNTEVCMYACKH